MDVAAVAEFDAVEIAALLPLRLRDLRQALGQALPDLLAVRIVRNREADGERLDLLHHGDDHVAMHAFMAAHAVDERLPVRRDRPGKLLARLGQGIGEDELRPRGCKRAGAVRLGSIVARPGQLEVGEGDRPADAGFRTALADRGVEFRPSGSGDRIRSLLLGRLPVGPTRQLALRRGPQSAKGEWLRSTRYFAREKASQTPPPIRKPPLMRDSSRTRRADSMLPARPATSA